MAAKLKPALSALDRGFETVLCSIGLCVMASCIMLQVILRYFFAAAAPWAEEVAVYAMVGAIYMGASLAVREGAHLRILIIHNRLPPKWRQATLAFADFLWFAFLGVWLWESVKFVGIYFEYATISPGLNINQKWPQSMVPFCVALMMARMVQFHWRRYKDAAKEQTE